MIEFGSTKSQRQIKTASPDVRNKFLAFLPSQKKLLVTKSKNIFSSSRLNIFFYINCISRFGKRAGAIPMFDIYDNWELHLPSWPSTFWIKKKLSIYLAIFQSLYWHNIIRIFVTFVQNVKLGFMTKIIFVYLLNYSLEDWKCLILF